MMPSPRRWYTHPAVLCLAAALFGCGGYLNARGLPTPTVTPWSVAAGVGLIALLGVLPTRRLPPLQAGSFLLILLGLALIKAVTLDHYHTPGLLARYYANDHHAPPHEISWRYRDLRRHATRIDPGLAFAPHGFSLTEPTFPLYFVNDWHRFNWRDTPEDDHRRKHFRFSAIWSGTLTLPTDVTQLRLAASGGPALVRVGTAVLYADTTTPDTATVTRTGPLTLAAEYRRLRDTAPSLVLTWRRGDGTWETVPPPAYAPAPGFTAGNPPWLTLHRVTLVGWWLTVALLAVVTVRWRALRDVHRGRLGLLMLFLLLSAAGLARQINQGEAPDSQIFTAGNDWLRYETQATDILMGDWLGARFTEGKPFFMNALYRYQLAGMHALAGEDPLMVAWFQQMLMAATLILLYVLGKACFNRPVAGLALAAALLSGPMLNFPSELLDTTYGILFSLLLLGGLLRYYQSADRRWLFLAAAGLALAVGTRANLFPFAFIAACWCVALPPQGARRRWTDALWLILAGALPLLLIGWRNAAVSGEWLFLPASGRFNLWLGNHPPAGNGHGPFDLPALPPASEQLSIALNYIREEPLAFLERIGQKLLYLFGYVYYEKRIHWGVLVPTTLALAGFVGALRARAPWRAERLLLGLWVTMNFGLLTLVFPWVYGWRLSGPTLPAIYLLMAMAVLEGVSRLRRSSPTLSPHTDR